MYFATSIMFAKKVGFYIVRRDGKEKLFSKESENLCLFVHLFSEYILKYK